MTLTAHDVRKLQMCHCGCRGLGLPHEMLKTDIGAIHRCCAYDKLGADALLALPSKERGKLRLCDVPRAVMKRLIEAVP